MIGASRGRREFERTQEQHLLRLEEDVGHVVWVAVDAQPVAQPRVNRTHGTDDRAPERGGDQSERAHAAFLDEVDEHIGLSHTQTRTGDPLPPEGRLTFDAGDLQARPLHRTGLCLASGGRAHQRIVPRPAEAAKFG